MNQSIKIFLIPTKENIEKAKGTLTPENFQLYLQELKALIISESDKIELEPYTEEC